ncbi:MAG: glycosyltransferase family 4 protein [Candidatus Hydrogenedentes bacterium]|nr:glycosyltransferase family 4 protein [Candidatus Hydrogenedentota bacterium]
MNLKVGLVAGCPYPVPQGSQIFIKENALALKRLGNEIHLIVYGYGTGATNEDIYIHRAPNPLSYHRTSSGPSIKKVFLDLMMIKTLKDVCKTHDIQVIFAHNYEGLLISLISGFRPIIYHAHNAMSDELPYYFNRFPNSLRTIGDILDKTLPKKADFIVVPHEKLAAHLILRGCKKSKVKVIPPPIDVSEFAVSKVNKDKIPPIIYTGNLDKYQNIKLLLKAFHRVKNEIKESRLIIGTHEEVKIDGVETIPVKNIDSLKRLLADDSIIAIPRVSWSGYPIKILNAMACAKPIVCCKGSAYGIKNGVNGLIVENDDEKEFAKALITLLREPELREKLGKEARSTVEKVNNPQTIGEQLQSLALLCVN